MGKHIISGSFFGYWLKKSDTGNLLNVNGKFRRTSEEQIRFSREAESLVRSRERCLPSSLWLLPAPVLHSATSHIPPIKPLATKHTTATIRLLKPRVDPNIISPLSHPTKPSPSHPRETRPPTNQHRIQPALQLTASLKPGILPVRQPHRRPTGQRGPADTESRTWDGAAQSSPLTGLGRDCRGHDGSGRSGASIKGGRAGAGEAGVRVRHEAVHQWRGKC